MGLRSGCLITDLLMLYKEKQVMTDIHSKRLYITFIPCRSIALRKDVVQILEQFGETRFGKNVWTLAPGSSLSFYDSQYYFLRFRKVDSISSGIQQVWNLPPEMVQKMNELNTLNSSAEEQAG